MGWSKGFIVKRSEIYPAFAKNHIRETLSYICAAQNELFVTRCLFLDLLQFVVNLAPNTYLILLERVFVL